jgi:hypothetical protein
VGRSALAIARLFNPYRDGVDENKMNSSIRMDSEPLKLFAEAHWIVSGRVAFIDFFSALVHLAPAGSVLQIEGNPYPDVEEGLEPWLYEESKKVAWLFRTAAKYSVPVTPENMTVLAQLAEHHAEPEVADHFILWHGDEQILNWYDAPSDPIYLAYLLKEERVALFAGNLGAVMKREAGSTG